MLHIYKIIRGKWMQNTTIEKEKENCFIATDIESLFIDGMH